MIETFGTSSFDTYVAVVTVPEGETVEGEPGRGRAVFDAVEKALPVARVVDYESTQNEGFITDDGRTTFALIQGPMPQSFGPGIETQIEPALAEAAEQTGLHHRADVVRPAVRGR